MFNKKKYIKIVPSIIAADFSIIKKEIKDVIYSGADWIHLDIMDNHYVPNLTIGIEIFKSIRKNINIPIDVHVMANPIDSIIDKFIDAGADIITFHPETSFNYKDNLFKIKNSGCKSGIAVNINQSLKFLENINIKYLDLVLIMSVKPGFCGQKFINKTFLKIQKTKFKIQNLNEKFSKKIFLEVDGGINLDNIYEISQKGADVFVLGSQIFRSLNYSYMINKLKYKIYNKIN